ncbi:hypothetical protein CRUP_005865, partial [Coryphaenoides rupestris]
NVSYHCNDQQCVANGISHEKVSNEGSVVASLEVFFSGYPRMVGLSLFPKLSQLTILGQNVSHIQGLEGCPLLQELWVAECQLTTIDGLQSCFQLQKLYLYDNHISKIENLDSQMNLQVLWLNNNCIACIEELTFLAPLPRLKALSLQDCQSVANPVCLLCNYATHVLYHMPGLQRLDSYDVSSRHVKEAAEKHLREAQSRLTEQKETLRRPPVEQIRACSRAIKDLEWVLSEIRDHRGRLSHSWEDDSAPSPPPASPSALIQNQEGQEGDDPADLSSDPEVELQILSKMEALAQRVTLCEQRLEEIEAWYKQELSQTNDGKECTVHFLLMELETVGNIRFEDGCSTDPWFASCHGLILSRFSVGDYKSHGITGLTITSITRVHNSALRLRFEEKLHSLLADEESTFCSHRNYKHWLEYLFYVPDPDRSSEENEMLHILEEGFLKAEQYKALGREAAVPLSNSLAVADRPRLEHALRQDPQSRPLSFTQGHVIVSKVFLGRCFPTREAEAMDACSYPKANSVYRNVNAEPGVRSQRGGPSQWFVFDHELVLPEYIVYFEYVTQGPPASPDLRVAGDPSPSLDDSRLLDLLNTEPVLKPRPRRIGLDQRTLLEVARANVLSQITVLNLHGNSLSKLKEISRLSSLRRLTISFNEPNLEFVDASYNRIASLDGWRGLGRLKELDLRWNRLTRAREEAAVLRKHAPALQKLDTRHNPWNRPDSVRTTMVARLVTLTHMDDAAVMEEEVAVAAQTAAGSRIHQASLLAHSRVDGECPRSLSLLSAAQLLCLLSPPPWPLHATPEPGWTARITALTLDGQGISRLTNLDKLVHLRWASFNDNDISKVEGLENCLDLQELSLNHNSITSMEGLSKLHRLVKLSLNGNQLHCLDAATLERLPNLHFLSGLTNLIILELYGNPLVDKLENYRIYLVFQLPALKALDGVRVEVTESENAKDVFGGRLSPDMVVEKLGHSDYSDVRDLTMQACSIRTVDLTPTNLFLNLQSVNLENNNLTSFSGLVDLPNIKALCLNHNHIESILPRQKSQAHLTNRQLLYHKVNSSGYGRPWPGKCSRDTLAAAVGSLEPLMGSLEVLHLSYNGISNMANLQLSRLTNLKALFLQGNNISQVEGLEGLTRLRELVLDRNRIKALGEGSLVGQSALLELHLAENRLRRLAHLEPLGQLRRLCLAANKLQDISELEKLEVLPSLIELSVVGNPCLGAVVPAPGEVSVPGLLPLVPRATPLKGLSLTGGPQQSFLQGHDAMLPCNLDDGQTHKRQRPGGAARGSHAEGSCRPGRRAGRGLPTAGATTHDPQMQRRARLASHNRRVKWIPGE